MKLQEDILNQNQKKLLKSLDFLAGTSLYMGGGTALALQLGHRTSVDFDLYSEKKFDVGNLRDLFIREVAGIEVIREHPDGTLQMQAERVEVSVFHYPYKPIAHRIEFYPVKLASLQDIAASKIAAVVQRARRRDFVDIYYLSKELGFSKVLECAYKKFPWYRDSSGIVLKSLAFFDEADTDDEADRVRMLDKNVTWEKVKNEINNMREISLHLLYTSPQKGRVI